MAQNNKEGLRATKMTNATFVDTGELGLSGSAGRCGSVGRIGSSPEIVGARTDFLMPIELIEVEDHHRALWQQQEPAEAPHAHYYPVTGQI